MIVFTPERLRFEDIRDRAEKFRLGKHYASSFPINIEEVIEFDLGLEIIPVPTLKQRIGVEAFLSNDLRSIWVDKTEYESTYNKRLQFTLAEEVGHFVLHRDIYVQGVKFEREGDFIKAVLGMNQDDVTWIDRQAREFAGRLLVPKDYLESYIKKNIEKINSALENLADDEDYTGLIIENFSKKVCADFNVSWEVIKNRIRKEGFTKYFVIPND
ncbi:ImmA/IrrE family metallo-endopeptidase [Flavobacterium sp. ASW18X]|uniref:ImmA/IrrE family metallo-endopeptidase n=1 Tax=Flavobacterium sp. ASW18X TaxID=2572595 RepID=UPI0010AE2135|nr:ImmA/IrrE family metallo-endopeptidase [Flavobacterium sp. ASW18X]TKD67324.1 ImmA/IrrE family metallo-endopeptidase [Flavobacterium sp. ASW18X]